MDTKKIYPITRFDELYYPSTYTFQFWLAVASFLSFIFTLFFRYSPSQSGWLVMDTSVSEYARYLQYVFWGVAVVLVVGILFAFVSLIIVVIKAIFGTKKKEIKNDRPDEPFRSVL